MTIDFSALREELVILPARDEHADRLIALISSIFSEFEGVLFHLDEMPELKTIATSFAVPGGEFWCAFRGEQLVGSIGWVPTPAGIELRKLYVARAERNMGLGGRLVALVEEAAKERGAPCIELWSDVKFTGAHRFYERRGYQRGPHTRALGDRSNTMESYFKKVLASS